MKAQEKSGLMRQPEAFLKARFSCRTAGHFQLNRYPQTHRNGLIHKKYAKFEHRFLNYPSLSRLYDDWCRKPESLKHRFSQKVTQKEQPTAWIM
jgi:hypothetical protein